PCFAERIECARPDHPLDHLLAKTGSLDDVGEVGIRAARQLGVEALLVFLADPLHEREPEPDAPARGTLGRPRFARGRPRDHASAGAHRSWPALDSDARWQLLAGLVIRRAVIAAHAGHRPARPPDPLGRGLVRAGVDVDRQDGDAMALSVI